MKRTIAVQGVGNLRRKPDQVEIGLSLETRDLQYDKAMSLSSERIDALNAALRAAGFGKDDLKTSAFNVRTEYRSEQDDKGRYHQVFDGYVSRTEMHLVFPLDMKKLGETLSAIGEAGVDPELNIRFTVKDPGEVYAELLREAAANARGKAEALCAASGVKLGKLQKINYNWAEPPLVSPTRVEAAMGSLRMMKNSFQADMTPEDIQLSDSAAFVWELE